MTYIILSVWGLFTAVLAFWPAAKDSLNVWNLGCGSLKFQAVPMMTTCARLFNWRFCIPKRAIPSWLCFQCTFLLVKPHFHWLMCLFHPFSWSNPSFCWLQSKFWLIRFHLVGGLEHFLFFPFNWECHHPNWRTHIFRRGRAQPPTSHFFVP